MTNDRNATDDGRRQQSQSLLGRRSTPASTLLSVVIIVLASVLGLGAFLYPFFLPGVEASGMMAHANDAPLVFVLVLVLCLAAVFASLTSQQMTSKLVALLGILTALSAVLRTMPDRQASTRSSCCRSCPATATARRSVSCWARCRCWSRR